MTDAMIANVIAQQLRDGRSQYVQMGSRPPIEDGDFASAALGIRATSPELAAWSRTLDRR